MNLWISLLTFRGLLDIIASECSLIIPFRDDSTGDAVKPIIVSDPTIQNPLLSNSTTGMPQCPPILAATHQVHASTHKTSAVKPSRPACPKSPTNTAPFQSTGPPNGSHGARPLCTCCRSAALSFHVSRFVKKSTQIRSYWREQNMMGATVTGNSSRCRRPPLICAVPETMRMRQAHRMRTSIAQMVRMCVRTRKRAVIRCRACLHTSQRHELHVSVLCIKRLRDRNAVSACACVRALCHSAPLFLENVPLQRPACQRKTMPCCRSACDLRQALRHSSAHGPALFRQWSGALQRFHNNRSAIRWVCTFLLRQHSSAPADGEWRWWRRRRPNRLTSSERWKLREGVVGGSLWFSSVGHRHKREMPAICGLRAQHSIIIIHYFDCSILPRMPIRPGYYVLCSILTGSCG